MIQKLPGAQLVNDRLEMIKDSTHQRINRVKEQAFRGGIVLLTSGIVIWLSVFMYVTFYYTYIPQLTHTRPVYIQFRTCNDSDSTICSFPTAHIQLTKRQQILMVGQRYKIYLNFEMPESEANKNLGMFMVCLELNDKDGILVANSCRPVMLHYKSWLLHIIKTVVYSPVLLFGSAEEKQYLSVEMFSDFEDDENRPVTDLYVEIQTKKIELYSASMHIHAHFTGLRYLMFHWPVLSAVVGISSNLLMLTFILLLSWYHLFYTTAGAYARNIMNQTPAFVDEIGSDLDRGKNKETSKILEQEISFAPNLPLLPEPSVYDFNLRVSLTRDTADQWNYCCITSRTWQNEFNENNSILTDDFNISKTRTRKTPDEDRTKPLNLSSP